MRMAQTVTAQLHSISQMMRFYNRQSLKGDDTMVLEDIDKQNCPEVIVFAPTETLTCIYCGQEYVSRGKNDPGYCRKCEKEGRQYDER